MSTWEPAGRAASQFGRYGKVQRRGGAWYADLSEDNRPDRTMGPFRTQRRAQDIVEEHAAPLIAKDREYAELALEVAARTARHPPSTRRRKHATAGAGRYPTKLKCEACGAVMLDCEACQSGGEYNHPYNGCRNASLSFTDLPEARGVWPGLVSARQRARGIVPVQPSRFRRAKRRGARAASRYRPK